MYDFDKITERKGTGCVKVDLVKKLGLPERLSANGLLQAVNALYGREEFTRLARKTLAAGEKEDAEDGAD